MKMNNVCKSYVIGVILAGIVVSAVALAQWRSSEPGLFALLLAVAALVSTLKVRLPGVWSSVTPASFFVLLGVGRFSLSEAVMVGVASAVAQSLINTRKTPRPTQVAFNAATLAISAGAASAASRLFLDVEGGYTGLAAGLVLAVQVHYLLNTSLVAGVISLTSGQQFASVWRQCNAWNLLYYLVVMPVAGVAWYVLPALSWRVFALLVPTLWLVHKGYGYLISEVIVLPQPASR